MCEICGQLPHKPGCPYWEPSEKDMTGYTCPICNEQILYGEEFVENNDGERAHYECIDDIDWLLDWLGYGVWEEQR